MRRTHLKNPHNREWPAKGAMTRRKAQGLAKAKSSIFNEISVPFAGHPDGRSAFAPSLCCFSLTMLWHRLRRSARLTKQNRLRYRLLGFLRWVLKFRIMTEAVMPTRSFTFSGSGSSSLMRTGRRWARRIHWKTGLTLGSML